ncbi:L-histidine N(alpha)-methyltransferase [Planctomycetaceae bacterium SH139]
MAISNLLPLVNLAPAQQSIRAEVLDSLAESPPRLPSKYFYDQHGSELFDAICELPEYYPTRTEVSILQRCLPELAEHIGEQAVVIEIGSGSGLKTELLLQALESPAVYIPMDISQTHLLQSAERLADLHPAVEIAPVCADFTAELAIPAEITAEGARVVYFPGSTLGNLTADAADQLLAKFADLVSPRVGDSNGDQTDEAEATTHAGMLVLGVDLQKDTDVLQAAYDDQQGVTAEFNRNILRHLNRQLAVDFPLDGFDHAAPFVSSHQRIEMRLVANRNIDVAIDSHNFRLRQGEHILTEYSHKYDPQTLGERLRTAGWSVEQMWTDPKNYFAIFCCRLTETKP